MENPWSILYARFTENNQNKKIRKSNKWLVQLLEFVITYMNFSRETETSELFDENGFVFMGDLGYLDNSGSLFYRYNKYIVYNTLMWNFLYITCELFILGFCIY